MRSHLVKAQGKGLEAMLDERAPSTRWPASSRYRCGCRDDGGRTGSLNGIPEDQAIRRISDRIVRGRHNGPQERQEFRRLNRRGIRRVDHILVSHLEILREEI